MKLNEEPVNLDRGQRGQKLEWPDSSGSANQGKTLSTLSCIGILLHDETLQQTIARVDEASGEHWNGQEMTPSEMKAVIDHAGVAASLSTSEDEVHMHCQAGGTAILTLESESGGNHAIIRKHGHIFDPDDFNGLGKFWIDGHPRVHIAGAVLMIDNETSDPI